MVFLLTSPVFAEGERIPDRYTCEGEDVSPPLLWADPPAGARSFALVCSDPDAPMGVWYHWAIFDLPAATADLPEAFPGAARVGSIRQATNDFRRVGYGGPCPPRGHGEHRYRFELTALSVLVLPLADRCNCWQVENAAARNRIVSANIIGVYSRS